MRNILFIAWHDTIYQLRQGSTLLWTVIMPPVFFYFIGTVTGGMSSTMGGGSGTPIVVTAVEPGFLQEQIDLRLRDNDFAPEWHDRLVPDEQGNLPQRVLAFGDNLTDAVLAGEVVTASFETRASALSRDFETIRVQRSLYTALADIVAADARSGNALSANALIELNNETRVWQLDVAPAGQRQEIPSGFNQAIPGILVMFTLLVLLTSGTSMLVVDRDQGLLRRLAYAPITRTEIVAGKWVGRLVLAAMQVAAAVAIGMFCAFIPVPFQMLIAAIFAIWLRANILVAVPTVWISNPLTLGPMFYFCYLLGAEMLGQEAGGFDFELSFDWLINGLAAIWQPFLLGCFTVGVIAALLAFVLVRVLWHLHIISHIKARARRLHNRHRHLPEKQ